MFVYTLVRARKVSDNEAIARAARSLSVGCYVVEKFGGRLVQCWHEVSSHNTLEKAQKAAKAYAKRNDLSYQE